MILFEAQDFIGEDIETKLQDVIDSNPSKGNIKETLLNNDMEVVTAALALNNAGVLDRLISLFNQIDLPKEYDQYSDWYWIDACINLLKARLYVKNENHSSVSSYTPKLISKSEASIIVIIALVVAIVIMLLSIYIFPPSILIFGVAWTQMAAYGVLAGMYFSFFISYLFRMRGYIKQRFTYILSATNMGKVISLAQEMLNAPDAVPDDGICFGVTMTSL